MENYYQEQLCLTTDEDECNYFQGANQQLLSSGFHFIEQQAIRPMPSATFRVVDGRLYQIINAQGNPL